MALAIDGSTPAIAANAVATVQAVTTASFTPPANALLLVLWSANDDGGPLQTLPTITDSLGAHLTYTLVDWRSHNDSPGAAGEVATWWAQTSSSAAMTVTVNNQSTSGSRESALAVIVLTGHNTSTPTGAHGANSSTSGTSGLAQSYTALATNGWGFLVAMDWAGMGNQTAGSGTTLIGSNTLGGNVNYGFFRRTAADDVNGASTTINTTNPGSTTQFSWAWVEVLPAAGGGSPAFVDNHRARLRVRLPFRRRTSRAQPPPAAILPPLVAKARARRWLPPRRHAVTPVPAQVIITPPAYPPSRIRARIRGALARRARTATPVPAQVVVTAPGYPPTVLRIKLRAALARRERTVAPVPAQVVLVASPLVPMAARIARRLLMWRRTRAVHPIAARQPTHQQASRPRAKWVRSSRARTAAPPLAQAVPPLLRGRPRLRVVAVRRPRAATPPLEQVGPLTVGRVRRRFAARLLRRPAAVVVPAQVVLIAPPFRPASPRIRRAVLRTRRGRSVAAGWMVVTVVDCQLPRPATGSTGRPGTGSTSRPTGTTARPTGITLRPNSGNTDNPC